MPIIIQKTMSALCAITKPLPIGTNLALLQFMWMLVSGSLLNSRGALFPGLLSIRLSPPAVRRAWAAFRGGAWQIEDLLCKWQDYVLQEGAWVVREYEGWRAKAVDITAFWRPRLKDCPSKHYHPQADKALPAIIMGVVGLIGQVGSQRMALPEHFVRVDASDPREATLQTRLIEQVIDLLGDDEVIVVDAGFKISQLHAAGAQRFVIRLAKNFTARRHQLPPYKGRGRKPDYGEGVRPLARTYKGNIIDATPPDQTVIWQEDELTLRADCTAVKILDRNHP